MENNIWQICPLCGGTGEILAPKFTSSIYIKCDVCNGKKIISTFNGLPPAEPQQEITSLKG